jgi:hypothetical protein
LAYVPWPLAQFRVHGDSTTEANKVSRDYKSRILDPLVILHEFAFHPLYARLREVARLQGPPVNFKEILAAYIKMARHMARKVKSNEFGKDSGPEAELKELCLAYPILRTIRKFPFLRSLQLLMWKLKRFMK